MLQRNKFCTVVVLSLFHKLELLRIACLGSQVGLQKKAFFLASSACFLALAAVILGAMNPTAQQATRQVSRNMATEVQGEINDQLEISKASQNTLNLQHEKIHWACKDS